MSWQTAANFYRQLAIINRTGISLPQAVVMAGNVASMVRIAGIMHRRGATPAPAVSDLASLMQRSGEYPLALALDQSRRAQRAHS